MTSTATQALVAKTPSEEKGDTHSLACNAVVGWLVAVAVFACRSCSTTTALMLRIIPTRNHRNCYCYCRCHCTPHYYSRCCCSVNGSSSFEKSLGSGSKSDEFESETQHELGRAAEDVDVLMKDWTRALWWSLKLDFSHRLCSKELKECLFPEDNDIDVDVDDIPFFDSNGKNLTPTMSSDSKIPWIARGVPQRPLYKEVAKRLFKWNQLQSFALSHTSSPLLPGDSCRESSVRLMMPATDLGFEELEDPTTITALTINTPPYSWRNILEWLCSVSADNKKSSGANVDGWIYRLLGIRHTEGSILPKNKRLSSLPSRKVLLYASSEFLPVKHKQKRPQSQHQTDYQSSQKQRQQLPPRKLHDRLTVAAKARSKHAHRAITGESYFGVVKGPVFQQNAEAYELVKRLLEDCVWINCHIFGGLNRESGDNTSWIMEIRQEQGYGARWLVEERELPNTGGDATRKQLDESRSTRVTFRGFLEPQMEGGHERKWRH